MRYDSGFRPLKSKQGNGEGLSATAEKCGEIVK